MKPILKSYKCIDKKIEATYIVENTLGDKLKVKEVEEYSKKREMELLNQLKQQILDKMVMYPQMNLNSEITMQNLMNGVTLTAMNVVSSNNVLGTVTLLASLNSLKDYIKQYTEIKKLEKFMYFYGNERNITEFISEYNYVNNDKNLNHKLARLYLKNDKINYHNVNKFSKKQLKKINEYKNNIEI